ncbi:MAG: DUF2846 domain-containing protein [Deltaproteobacteria bacterium]|nr:DUF2846 domain-containing protein [Deltaproteobacteria bacterium]
MDDKQVQSRSFPPALQSFYRYRMRIKMKKQSLYALPVLAAFVMLIGACVTVPVAAPDIDARTKKMTPPSDKALLYVYRTAVFIGSAVLTEIFVDGSAAGSLAEKSYLAVLLEPGKHRVHGRNPQYALPTLFEAGKTYYVKATTGFPRPVLVDAGEAKKDMADYGLIDESDDLLRVVRASQKPASAGGAPAPESVTAAAVPSDIDDVPKAFTPLRKNAYALVIGIENYRQKLPRADYAAQDARLVSAYLVKTLGIPEEHVVTLLNDRALKSDFEKYFEKWLGNNVEAGGTVFVYFSGHGAPNPKTGDAYLVPYDGDPSFIDQTGYSLKRMYDALGRLPAKEIVVALDSCFSGAGGRSVLAQGARPLVMNLQKSRALPENLTVLAASSGDQISSTYKEKGHGLFTYFLLKGIKNEDVVKADGSLKLDDLYGYLKPQVERIARRQYNNEQTPQLFSGQR